MHALVLSSADFFNYSKKTLHVSGLSSYFSKSFNPEQARRFVGKTFGPDLDRTCL